MSDLRYGYVYVCPATSQVVSDHDHAYSRGVCHVCGNVSNSTFTHAEKSVGEIKYKGIFHRMFGIGYVDINSPPTSKKEEK